MAHTPQPATPITPNPTTPGDSDSLLDGGFIRRDPELLARIALHLDVPVATLRDAYRRRADGRVYPLSARPVDLSTPPLPSGPRPVQREARFPTKRVTEVQRANLSTHVAKRKEAKEPVEGMRLCSAPCHDGERLILKSEFSVKDAYKGTLRAWCKPCMRVYAQSRYLTSEKLERFGHALRFVLGEGDELAGSLCSDCGQACEVGQEVVARTSAVYHSACVGSNVRTGEQ